MSLSNRSASAHITEPEIREEKSIVQLIALGESKTLEFKSTLQWDVIRNEQNAHLRHAVLKTLAAFLNSEGGTLIIGVDDTGTALGLEPDLKLLGGSADRFLQLSEFPQCRLRWFAI